MDTSNELHTSQLGVDYVFPSQKTAEQDIVFHFSTGEMMRDERHPTGGSLTVDFDSHPNIFLGRTDSQGNPSESLQKAGGLMVDVAEKGQNTNVSRVHGKLFKPKYKWHDNEVKDPVPNAAMDQPVLIYDDSSSNGTVIIEPDIDEATNTITYQRKFGLGKRYVHYAGISERIELKNGSIVMIPDSSQRKGLQILCLRDILRPTQWTFTAVDDIANINPIELEKHISKLQAQPTISVKEDPLSPSERTEFEYYRRLNLLTEDGRLEPLNMLSFNEKRYEQFKAKIDANVTKEQH